MHLKQTNMDFLWLDDRDFGRENVKKTPLVKQWPHSNIVSLHIDDGRN